MRTSCLVAALMCVISSAAMSAPRPAVVELFTSEGCSSCPPAESYLGDLARRPDVLALAFHVDYWDDLGWHDRFDLADATPRQRGYAESLHLWGIYTPQVVVDGRENFVGNDRRSIGKSLAAPREGIPVTIELRNGAILIALSAASGMSPSEVLFIAYRHSAISAIGRGENAGRTLTEYNIVRAMRHLGSYTGGTLHLRVDAASLPQDATDVAVLVQGARQGAIVAAATQPLPAGR